MPGFITEKIQAAIEVSESEFIYTISGNYPKDFYPTLKRAVETAGLEYGRANPNGITFHSNRHSFVTRLVQVTDIATAQTFSGHSDAVMVNYYSHASRESRRSAMENLYNNKKDFEADALREIFERVKSGEMDFAEFFERLSGQKIKAMGKK